MHVYKQLRFPAVKLDLKAVYYFTGFKSDEYETEHYIFGNTAPYRAERSRTTSVKSTKPTCK